MTPDRVAQRKGKLAIWVREGLVKLGPTFIKIGQQFSTRVDVLSPEFVKELEKLQVGTAAFPLLLITGQAACVFVCCTSASAMCSSVVLGFCEQGEQDLMLSSQVPPMSSEAPSMVSTTKSVTLLLMQLTVPCAQ